VIHETLGRRQSDRITELCVRMVGAPGDELPALAAKLRNELAEHSLRLDNLTTATTLAWPNFPAERRRRTKTSALSKLLTACLGRPRP
jgi:hypothetical protein